MSYEKGRVSVLAKVSLILAAVFWGLNYAATKYATDFVPPSLLVTFRSVLGGLLLLGIYLARRRCTGGQTRKGVSIWVPRTTTWKTST